VILWKRNAVLLSALNNRPGAASEAVHHGFALERRPLAAFLHLG
jgi:hypothetical protein